METTMTMITTSADRIRRDSQDDDEVSVVQRKGVGPWLGHFIGIEIAVCGPLTS